MNARELEMEREARRQAAAMDAERLGLPPGDPMLDRERLLLRALRSEPPMLLPADFARAVAERAERRPHRAGAEDWLMTLLLGGLGIGGLYYLQPYLLLVLRTLHFDLPAVPWPMVVATVAALGVAWAVDQGATRLDPRRR